MDIVVVWCNFIPPSHTDGGDIYIENIATTVETLIRMNAGDPEITRLIRSSISGDLLVWEDIRNGNWDLYGYDLSSQTEFSVCTDSASQFFPDNEGNFVVWQDDRNGNWDIFGYDLSTETEFPVATGLGDQIAPSISGNTVVWEDNGDIYGAKIITKEPVYFADENLKAAVEAELGIENPNTNDMLSLTRLEAQDLGITDLTGLGFAENLSVLYLYYNEITDLGPIAELPNLTYIHLSHNQIEVLPDLSSWTKIRNLYLYHNKISDISPLTNPEITDLRYLRIYDNETLPVEAYRDYIPAIKANNPKLVDFSYDYPCEPMLVGDLNNDCAVNLGDLAIMASDWLECTHVYQELCP